MAIYFFTEPYDRAEDRAEVEQKLEELSFQEAKSLADYKSENGLFIVNFTDNKKGCFQIQGNGPEDIQEKGQQSEHYSMLEKMAKVLSPKQIVNDVYEDIFPELVQN
jgi:hypothetical protein